MKKQLLFLFLIAFTTVLNAQKNNSWSFLDSERQVNTNKIRTTEYSENQKLLSFDSSKLSQALINVADVKSGLSGVEVIFPNINGEMERFLVWESSNFEPGLQAKYPEIRAFAGKSVDNPGSTIRFSFSPYGVQTMVFRPNTGSEFIEPYTKDNSVYVLFDSQTRIIGQLPFSCGTQDVALSQELSGSIVSQNRASNQVYKTMRLALSCTGEYGAYFGGVSQAIAAMNATMTRCNGVFERDLAVKLLMIDNNDVVVYTNASTDPYSAAATGSNGAWNTELMNNLHNTLGDDAFDIGHLFGASGGGGRAGCIGCVCTNVLSTGGGSNSSYKGAGFTSPADGVPQGDNFDIDYVAHEMGHQMGANHTFSHTSENNSVNVAPGSGTTIMAYAGLGGTGIDIQLHSDDYFTYKSIAQIQSNMNTKTCPISYNSSTSPAFNNVKPTVSAGLDYTIPISTAFKLTGAASDTDGEVLSYCWEQNDDATTVGSTACIPSPTKTNGPNFRSRPPVATPVRYMPPLANVLAGSVSTYWETTSSVSRNLTFALTVRDNVLNGGQTNSDANAITVTSTAGPFQVTSQNSAGINWVQNTQETITWNVNNTTALPGSANVNIKLSTDGGLNFDTVLAANTPNDGSEIITVPDITGANCRILIEPTDNIYYTVNSKAFTIGYDCHIYSTNPNAAIADGAGTNQAGATTTSIINVPDNITISNMKVNLKINHTKIGDLVVKITHPDGTLRTLWSRSCNSATYSNIDVTFADEYSTISCASPTSGSYRSFQTLSGFNNKSSLGNWTLTVTDNNINNTGTLVSWGVDFGCTLGVNQNEFSDLVVYPNPSKGNFNVQFTNAEASKVQLSLYDISGRNIYNNTYDGNSYFNENVQLNSLQAGVYLLNVSNGKINQTKRIVIE